MAPKALLGNRYGHRALPRLIPEKHFEVLLSKLHRRPEGVNLLTKWYVRDNNAIPPTYVLQPITAQFPHYNDLRPESGPQHDKALLSWRLTDSTLLQQLRFASSAAEAAGDITAEEKELFFTSGQRDQTPTFVLHFLYLYSERLCDICVFSSCL